MMKIFSYILWAFWMCCIPAYAHPKLLTLEDAIFLSLRHNPNVQNGEIQRIVDKFNLRVAENQYEWHFGLAGNYQKSENTIKGLHSRETTSVLTPTASLNGTFGTSYSIGSNHPNTNGILNPGINIEITQPLLRGFGSDVNLAPLYNAQDAEEQAKLSLKNTISSTVVSVINAYRRLILAQNNLKISEKALEAYQQTIDSDNARIRSGQKAPIDVLHAQAQYASEEVSLQGARNDVMLAKLELLNTIGLPPETDISVPADAEDILPIKPVMEDSYQTALKNNIDYLNTLISMRALKRDVYLANDAALPLLNLSFSGNTSNGVDIADSNAPFSSIISGKDTYFAGTLTFELPIDNYANKQRILNAKIALQKAEISLSAQTRQLKTQILTNVNDVISNLKRVELAENALKLREKDQHTVSVQLKYGLVSTFEVTSKQQELNNTRQQLINAKLQYLNSLTVLYANMGVILDEWKISITY